jgi:hypothetical protein
LARFAAGIAARFGSRCAAAVAASVAIATLTGFAPPAVADPSPDDVRRQREVASQLDATADTQEAAVTAAQEKLRTLADQAGAALEAYEQAHTAAREHAEEAARQQALLEAATRDAASARVEIGRFASAAYRTTGGTGDLGPMIAVLDSHSPTDFWRGIAVLQSVGDQRAAALTRLRLAEDTQARATAAAREAATAASAAEATMRSRKATADALVAEQEQAVADLAEQLTRIRGQAAEANRKAAAMERALAVLASREPAAEAARRAALASGEVVLGPGECQGGEVDSWPNGMIPAALLCPLWGAPYQLLRADAAAAFTRMSKAYAEEFDRPICVTDSYRSYQMQVDLARRKPTLAAVPGTSNHGWAKAVDLCDGVNVFGTPTHEWLKANAPRFGWFHPGWAEPGGSRPEPWHWEYAG